MMSNRVRSTSGVRAILVLLLSACISISVSAAPSLVGDVHHPAGINDLVISYSGGARIFDVQFIEGAFNDRYGSGIVPISVNPFRNLADAQAAASSILDALNTLQSSPFYAGTPSDLQPNYAIGIPYTWTPTHLGDTVGVWNSLGTGPWTQAVEDYSFVSRDLYEGAAVFATFTDNGPAMPAAPVPGALVLAMIGAGSVARIGRRWA